MRKVLSSAAMCQICPIRSQKQQSLFEDANRRERLEKSIRALQKELQVLLTTSESAVLLRYARWELPTETEAGDLLRKRLLSSGEQAKMTSANSS